MDEKQDLPLGLGMAIARDQQASQYFCSLSQSEKNKVVNYIETNANYADAKQLIETAVDSLRSCDNSLFR